MRRTLLLALTFIFLCAGLSFAEVKRKFYKNGKVKWERTYLNGKLNGAYNIYWPNGRIKERRFYRDGQLIQMIQRFSSDGVFLGN